MNILRRCVRLLVLLVLWCAGLSVFAAAGSPRIWGEAVFLVQRYRDIAFWAGGGVLGLGLIFALLELRGRRREQFLSFDNEGGTVSISTDAIADYILKLASEFPSVVRMQPRVAPRRRSVDIRVDLRVRAGSQIHEVCQLLQQRVRESMVNGLGIAEVRKIEVNVREIVSEHRLS